MMSRLMNFMLLIGFYVAILIGCKPTQTSATKVTTYAGKYPIATTVTVGMVADLVREIGGEQVEVTQLLGSGVDPHLHKPTRDDVQALTQADCVFYNGLLLEGKMAEVLERLNTTKLSVPVAGGIKIDHSDGDDHSHPDPHVWMDVSLWSQAAQVVCDELSRFDPPHRDDYAARTKLLRERLAALHEYGKQQIGGIPKDQRVLVTSHDAFRYFGRAYGIEVEAIQGISTESEAGLQRINELVDILVERKIGAVFIESSVPKESIEALLKGAASRGHVVKIGGELFSDAMGEPGKYEGTYLGMMDHNLTTVAQSLGNPDVPKGGFAGSQSAIGGTPSAPKSD